VATTSADYAGALSSATGVPRLQIFLNASAGAFILGIPSLWIAVVWVAIITVLFCLPEVSPLTWHTFNYAPFAVGAVLVFSGTWSLVSARKWFAGPHRQIDEAPLRAADTTG
jgi:hypothetical protein